MSKRCYYDILGVEPTVSDGELKSVFRQLALRWHPDRNPGDASCEVRFKEINEAYDILKDPEKRAQYDHLGHAAFQQGGVSGATGFGADFGSSFSDLFEGIFGMSAAHRAPPDRGSDLRYKLEITLEDAFAGKTAELRLPTSLSCEDCSGTGAKAGTHARTCPECGGAGSIRHAQGPFTLERTCASCQGAGRVIESPCPTCAGAGRATRERTLSVNIPPGVEDGTRIRLAGKGEAGMRGGRAGDLLVFLSIAPHAVFERDGADLHCRVPISMSQAALGAEIEVPTIEGRVARVKVLEGVQTGRRFRLRGKGMPILRSPESGDMYVEVVVETPQRLTKRQRELLSEFESLSSHGKRSKWGGSDAREPVGA